ncbi:MAG: uroporphyrinogen-III synthase, partial [Candidatus Omnitrophica bacterium]|nr:uroporphyrinogen-III synthase [Candidatus Omnitrophota bacterium]
ILMGFSNLEKIVAQITADRMMLKMPVALISNGTLPTQKVVTGTLANIVARVKASGMKAPAIIVIGKVVALRDQLNWFTPPLLLQGKRILVTRPEHQASELVGILEGHGARVTSIPLIRIVPSKNTAQIKARLSALDQFNWLIFTSVNGVDLFLKAVAKHKISIASLKNKKFAAIGKKTAEHLEQAGIKVDLVPKDFVQEALAATMIKTIAKESKGVLLAHSAGSRPVLEQKLRAAGLKIETLDLYSAEPIKENHARVHTMFAKRQVDAVMLTSSSCAESFLSVFKKAQLKAQTKGVVVASIGPITSDTARRAGLPVAVEADVYTIEGITAALIEYYQGQKRVQA